MTINGLSITNWFNRFFNKSDKIQLNHYWCRSLEEHCEKVERGLADTTRRTRTIDEFYERERDANKVEDRTILEVLELLK